MSAESPATHPPASPYSRNNPFRAKLVTNRSVSLPGSAKDTRHIELSLEGSGLSYEVGDSLAVFPSNCPDLVSDVLAALGFSGDEEVAEAGAPLKRPLRQALLHEYQITKPTLKFLKDLAARSPAAPLLKELLKPERKGELETYLWGMEIVDFLHDNPSAKYAPEEFLTAALSKLIPRSYSISSSLKAHPGQVHLTVDIVRYESHGRARKGVCSTFLADRCHDSGVGVFPTTSKFRLPEDGNTPIIMVGPGTGVAPFRAFLQERKAIGAKGKNWLFFGSQRRATDYFYEEEFEAMKADGFLTRLDLAFSRDQETKVYVQNRMTENAAEIWKWIEEGAVFFVCGDAKHMAKDVDAELQNIISKQGGMTPEKTREFVENLKKIGRYKRDVY